MDFGCESLRMSIRRVKGEETDLDRAPHLSRGFIVVASAMHIAPNSAGLGHPTFKAHFALERNYAAPKQMS
jgi:hypothetical protein